MDSPTAPPPTDPPTEPSTQPVAVAGRPGPPPTGPPPTDDARPTPPRRLRRSSRESLLGGVAGGVAEYFGIDPMLVRIAFVVAAFFGGLGVIAYVIGWIALPLAPSPAGVAASHGDRKQLLGYALVALGLLVVGGPFGWSSTGSGLFWPVVLIGLGVAVLVLRARDGQAGGGPDAGPPVGPPAPDAPQAACAPGSPQADKPADAQADVPDDARADLPTDAPTDAAPARPRSPLGAITGSALLVLVGSAWVVDAAGIAEVDVRVVVALALVVVGIALVVSAWYGRARKLIALGIPLALAVGVLGLVDVPLEGGIGDTTYRPGSTAALERSYELAIGRLTVDLGAVDFSGERRRVHTQLGVGHLDVTVPDDVRVVVDARAGVGDVSALGRDRDTCCPQEIRVVAPGTPGSGTLLLDAEVGAGHIEIEREDRFRGPS